MLFGILIAAMLIARLFPDLPIGRRVHFYLVEAPLQLASRIERKHVIVAVIVLVAGQALLLAAPIDVALVYAFDLSIYVDAFVAVSAAAALSKARLAWWGAKARALRLTRMFRSRPARPRTRRGVGRRLERPAGNDDDADPREVARAA